MTDEPNLSPRAVRCGQAFDLALDPDLATAQVMAALAQGGRALPVDAFNALTEINRSLVEAPEGAILRNLTRQAALLEALWLHFAARAAAESRPDWASSLTKAALSCQRNLGAVLGAIRQMNDDKRDAEALDS